MNKERIAADALRAEVEIVNQLGLHARAAARFVETATKFAAEITVANGEESVSGKSILGLMMLAAAQGTKLTITAVGGDAEPALDALGDLIARCFDEES